MDLPCDSFFQKCDDMMAALFDDDDSGLGMDFDFRNDGAISPVKQTAISQKRQRRFSPETGTYSKQSHDLIAAKSENADNMFKPEDMSRLFTDTSPTVLIFHCEFSIERGPAMCRNLRQKDRETNADNYPHLFYPEIYLLQGGYKSFYQTYPELCTAEGYLPMLDKSHASDLRHFRVKSKSWSVGQKNYSGSKMERIVKYLNNIKEDRKFIVAIVFCTNIIDNLLISCIVPIIPEMLVIQDEQMMEDCDEQTVNISLNMTTDAPSTSFSSISFAKRLFELSFNPATENSKIGWILAVKALVQIVFNPLTGYLANSGMHGLGSSATNVAGMSLLAERYHEDGERSRVMGTAMAGIAVGVLIGYPFGSLLYFYVGSSAPFLLILVFVVLDIAFIILVCKPVLLEKRSYHGSTITVLLRDPYILVGACIIMLATMSISTVEATVPIWVLDTMDVEKWELAVLFIPDSAGYVIGTNFFGNLALKMGRWIVSMVCLLLIGICLISIPFATTLPHLIVPHFGFGLGLGIIDAAIVPLLALLVDTRHVAMYGCVYAINQLSVCLAYGLGPGIAGQIVKGLGFSW
ncbi:synaptic vesicular amine transporter-like [Mytilus californianus]|uniref:synaptic vesicular amine transporter-like n=1 Tax=Mytilus californianus TaxID=6549 RepID=UPI002245102D|nr:synaptic vesicular amine transporter-like [Mytilus californianus]